MSVIVIRRQDSSTPTPWWAALILTLALASLTGTPLAAEANDGSPSGGHSVDTVEKPPPPRDPLVAEVNAGNWVQGVDVNPITNTAYIAAPITGEVLALDARTNKVKARIQTGGTPTDAGVNPFTNRIYVTSADVHPSIIVIDGRSNQVVVRIGLNSDLITQPQGIAINLVTKRAYVSAACCAVAVIDLRSETVAAVIPGGVVSPGVAVNPLTNKVYVTRIEGIVDVIDGATSAVSTSIPVGPSGASGVVVSSLRNRVYVTNHFDGTLTVIDGRSERVIRVVPGVGSWAPSLDVLRGRLYTVGPDDRLNVFSERSGALIQSMPLPFDPELGTVAFSAVNLRSGRLYVTDRFTGRIWVLQLDRSRMARGYEAALLAS